MNKISIYYLILVFLISASIITSQIDSIYAKDESEIKDSNKEQEDEILIKILSASVLAAIITSSLTVLGIFLKPVIERKFNILSNYDEPYTKWRIQVHGAIREFSELCNAIRNDRQDAWGNKMPNQHATSIVSNPIFIITHFWDMHIEVEQGYKWLGLIEKGDSCEAKMLNNLFDAVDAFWHKLEKEHIVLLGKQSTPDERRQILTNSYTTYNIVTGKIVAVEIKDKIISEIINKDDYSWDKFVNFEKFFIKKIPK